MLKKTIYPIAFMVIALLAFAMLAVPRARAAPTVATFTVDSTLDEPDSNVGDGICSSTPSAKCTLRAAVMQASVILVDTTILVPSGIYTLTIPPVGPDGPETGDLNLTNPASGNPVISILGDGASTTIIDGNQLDHVFNIVPGRKASISDVTIRNGYTLNDGGGIYEGGAGGTLTVNNFVISGNYAAGNGGGIYNNAMLYISNSTISQNRAVFPAAVVFTTILR